MAFLPESESESPLFFRESTLLRLRDSRNLEETFQDFVDEVG